MATAARRRAGRAAAAPQRGSDLGRRILVAIPAIAFAIAIIYFGGATFAAGALALGLVCIHELFTMLERMRPVRLAGFLGVSGLVAGARLRRRGDVLLALVAFLPVLFLLTVASPVRERITLSLAATLLGVYWIGLGLAHAVLLRGLDHGGALVFMVLLGTFVGDTAAYLGGRTFGTRQLAPRISPNKTWEGLGDRGRRLRAGRSGTRAAPTTATGSAGPRACCSASPSRSPRRSATSSSR